MRNCTVKGLYLNLTHRLSSSFTLDNDFWFEYRVYSANKTDPQLALQHWPLRVNRLDIQLANSAALSFHLLSACSTPADSRCRTRRPADNSSASFTTPSRPAALSPPTSVALTAPFMTWTWTRSIPMSLSEMRECYREDFCLEIKDLTLLFLTQGHR